MSSSLSFDIDGIKYNKSGFLNTLDYGISAPNENNEYLYRFKNTLLNDSISKGWIGYGTQYIDSVDWDTLQSDIANKLNEWIYIWNINNQYYEFIGLLEDKTDYNIKELISLISNKKINDITSEILLLESNIKSLDSYRKKPEFPDLPKKPNYNLNEYLDVIDSLFFKKMKAEEYDKKYQIELDKWDEECKSLRENYSSLSEKYENNIIEYGNKINEFNEKKIQLNKEINYLKEFIIIFENAPLENIIDFILKYKYIPYPFKNEYEFQYTQENKLLIIDFLLPSPDDYYKFKNAYYKEFKSKPSELKYISYKQKEFNDLYNKIIYKLNLLFCHDIFTSDSKNEINSISINGWVNHLDKSIGKYVKKCITSVIINQREFLDININYVDPEVCFKSLKGISASNLLNMLPIAPINNINKNDKRFVQNKDIIHQIHTGINLTEMNWEDFEHLVRELFEKEFSINGGEVKITQASRDGGVDAIAFDPDPIRGGKIIIQAKRYNNIVGVSAVRDLYGTTLNEGANKGILVTTSNYGSDAYEFAKGKPITLLNGGNLLSLLEKHGYNAQIKLNSKKLN